MLKLILFFSFFLSFLSWSSGKKNIRLDKVQACRHHMDSFGISEKRAQEVALEKLGALADFLPKSKTQMVSIFEGQSDHKFSGALLKIVGETQEFFKKSSVGIEEINKKLVIAEKVLAPHLKYWKDRTRYAPRGGQVDPGSLKRIYQTRVTRLKGDIEELRVSFSLSNVTMIESHVHTILSKEEKQGVLLNENFAHALKYEMDAVQEFLDGSENWIEVKHLSRGFGDDPDWVQRISEKMERLSLLRDFLNEEFDRDISIQIHLHGDGEISKEFEGFLKSLDVIVDTSKVPDPEIKRSLPRSYLSK